jgi:beta-glucosidase/6-phospho-beta-glucosidase/beta-galactosidase
MAGRLPEFLCPPECAGQQDFVGFDYYWGIPSVRLHDLMQLYDSMRQRFEKAPVHAGGLYRLLKFYSKMFPGQELIVIENGSVESADGVKRGSYIRRHVRQVQRARARKIPVNGYLCWSITSNREWGLPFTPHSDFGLYHVALDDDPHLMRVPTVAGEIYKGIIAARGA